MGTDDDRVLTLTLDGDGGPIDLGVAADWNDFVAAPELGAAVVAAFGRAADGRARAGVPEGAAGNRTDPTGTPASGDTAAAERARLSDDELRRRIREMTARVRDRGRTVHEEIVTVLGEHDSTDDEDDVGGRFIAGVPVAIRYDPEFLEQASPTQIAHETLHLLRREWANRREWDQLPGIAEAMALQAAVTGPGGLLERLTAPEEVDGP